MQNNGSLSVSGDSRPDSVPPTIPAVCLGEGGGGVVGPLPYHATTHHIVWITVTNHNYDTKSSQNTAGRSTSKKVLNHELR